MFGKKDHKDSDSWLVLNHPEQNPYDFELHNQMDADSTYTHLTLPRSNNSLHRTAGQDSTRQVISRIM